MVIASSYAQAMVMTYWQIRQLVVEDKQSGKARAEYGKTVIKKMSDRLTQKFGKGFDIRNLRYMRRFYLAFPIRDALRPDLGRTHYRLLLNLESEVARQWYMLREASSEGWSIRALEQQINSFYHERLLSSQDEVPARTEAKQNAQALSPKDVLKDPYVLEFLELGEHQSFTESELESVLIEQKLGKLLHQDIGQMDTYVRLYEERFRREDG